jgi:predicted nucleic acid-binding protein
MRQVAVDTDVIINLYQADRFEVFETISDSRFNVTDEVRSEVVIAEQRDRVLTAINDGILHCVTLDATELETYVLLRTFKEGAGECSCLAIAKNRQWHVATDERRDLLPMIKRTVGRNRILRSKDLIRAADRRVKQLVGS